MGADTGHKEDMAMTIESGTFMSGVINAFVFVCALGVVVFGLLIVVPFLALRRDIK